ncbi:hypothetical protein BDW59DRAFT_18886 [Aspergillus cavernicola]|uniref:Malate dehydrogenase n=1 Tax=Aspergillus cavernicola TaxID=176166 RepID=A0ABR4ISE0_9EURO
MRFEKHRSLSTSTLNKFFILEPAKPIKATMIWTTPIFPILISLLSVTANAKPHYPSSTTSFYASMVTTILKSLDLTSCSLGDSIALPQSTLPAPSEGLALKSLTLGRGTQNYTCATNANTTTPEAIGATATLFDISCLAALATDTNDDETENQSPLHILPDMLRLIPLSSVDFVASLLNSFTGQDLIIGKHYFTEDGVPFFDLRGSDNSSRSTSENYIAAEKEDEMDAPAKPGYGITGDVEWLKLNRVEGGFREVYRVHTAGGSAPATCEGMPEVFTVDYSSEYWFYG